MFLMICFVFLLLAIFLGYTIHDLYLIYIRGFPPGPLSLPVIGGLHHLSPSKPNQSLLKLVEKYPKIFSLRLGPAGRIVIIQDLDLILKLYAMQEAANRPVLPFMGILSAGADGLGSINYGQKWKLITKIFHTGLTKLSQKTFSDNAIKIFLQTKNIFSKHANTPYDPREDIRRTFYAIMGSLVYGIDEVEINSNTISRLLKYHTTIVGLLNPAHPINIFPWLWNLPSPFKTNTTKCLQERDNLLYTSFERHLSEYAGTIEDVMSIAASFMNDHKEKLENASITLPDLMLTIWTMFLAGTDTQGDNCMWMCLYLAMNPDVQTKIQDEIDDHVPSNENVTLLHKENLHYTRATILETLRLATTVLLGIPHYNNTDISLGGYTIPKGTTIMQYAWSVHHDPDRWEDPESFKPDRFLQDDGTLFPQYHIFRELPFIPYGLGKRTCLGKHLSLDTMFLFLTTVMKNFRFEIPAGFVLNLNGKMTFNLMPADYQIIIRER